MDVKWKDCSIKKIRGKMKIIFAEKTAKMYFFMFCKINIFELALNKNKTILRKTEI